MIKTVEEYALEKLDEIRKLELEKRPDEASTARNELESIMKGSNLELQDLEDRMEVIYV